MPVIKSETFQALGTQDWVNLARGAVQTQRTAPTESVRSRIVGNTPAIRPSRTGLRGLESTQDLDGIETKGLIIDRYL